MFENFINLKHKDTCPICKSNYNDFSCKREEWKNGDCNCYLQNKLWKDYTLANIPNDYFSKDITDYEFAEQNKDKKFFIEINKYINYLDNVYESGSGLFLYSETPSVGKTFFGISILKAAYKLEYSIYFSPFVHIYNKITTMKDYSDFIDKLNVYDFLLIDGIDRDIKRDFLTDVKVLNFFEEFLKKRFKPIIFTSSSTPINSRFEPIKIVKACLKDRIYELNIDSTFQYNNSNFWDKIMNAKKEIIK